MKRWQCAETQVSLCRPVSQGGGRLLPSYTSTHTNSLDRHPAAARAPAPHWARRRHCSHLYINLKFMHEFMYKFTYKSDLKQVSYTCHQSLSGISVLAILLSPLYIVVSSLSYTQRHTTHPHTPDLTRDKDQKVLQPLLT